MMLEEVSHIQPRRIAMLVAAIVIGFLFAEVPYNDQLLSMHIWYVAYGLVISAVVLAVFYTFGLHTRASVCAYLAACFGWGTAQYFVSAFKGLPIQPSDLLALGTAAEVAGGFNYVPNLQVVICAILLVICCVVIAKFVPKKKPTHAEMLIHVICGIAIISGCYWYSQNYKLADEAQVKIDVWFVLDSYKKQGSALSFLVLAQKMDVEEPEGYSEDVVTEYVDTAKGESKIKTRGNAATVKPTVIAVMNETFSDLSAYPGLGYTSDCVKNFKKIQSQSVLSGDCYVSALGGGTCNSEFEFLTSLSMGNIDGGTYPYVAYSFKGVKSMVSYLKGQGYSTHAMHPAGGTNWSRNRVYGQLGFDSFDDISAFEDADTLRNKTTDAATYDRVIELLDEAKSSGDESPQFVFDVTYQNHSGYTSGLVPSKMYYEATVNGEPNTELSEYLSVIRQSDKMLAKFIKQLKKRDEPIVLIFFGDHQPGFATELYETCYGKSVSEIPTSETQKRYTTPYFVWANYDTGADAVSENLSTNYLAAESFNILGYDLDSYYDFILDTKDVVPAMNLNGFQLNDDTWHWYAEDTEAKEALKKYSIVQFGNLFGRRSAGTE